MKPAAVQSPSMAKASRISRLRMTAKLVADERVLAILVLRMVLAALAMRLRLAGVNGLLLDHPEGAQGCSE